MNKLVINKKFLSLTLVVLSGLVLIGCAEQRGSQGEAVTRYNASFEKVWEACLASLEEHSFQIDRHDRRFGLIVSKPVAGKQFFEFWRKDTASGYDVLNSSLHTIRRVVTIRIAKQGPTQFQVDIKAHAQRISTSSSQLNSTVEAFELMGSQGVHVSPRRSDYLSPRAEPVWVDIGREGYLEQAIIKDIARRLESTS